jgi:hypothetical protein
MVSVDHTGPVGTDPGDVVDRLLWQDAQQMLSRHRSPDVHGLCGWCGDAWPCPPRRLAERAAEAARRPWREGWTTRHDMNSMRALPAWRADLGGSGRTGNDQHGGAARHRREPVNRGAFD